MDNGNTQVEPPFHAAGEGGRSLAGSVAQSGQLQNLVDAPVQVAAAQPVEFPEKSQVLAGGQLAVNGQILRADADRSTKGPVAPIQRLAVEIHLAHGSVGEAGHNR
jgi:hypothetical protein